MAAFAPGKLYDTGGRQYGGRFSGGGRASPPSGTIRQMGGRLAGRGQAQPYLNTMRATARGLGRSTRGRGMKRGFSRRSSR